MYLLDTVVLSELRRSRPEERVVRWAAAQRPATLFLSALTIGEIRKGVVLATTPVESQKLDEWLGRALVRFRGRIIPITVEIAERWGVLTAEGKIRGRTRPPVDTLIAATAAVHSLTVVTRNVRHFEDNGVPVLNPWEPT